MTSGELRVEPADLTAKAGALTTEISDASAEPAAPCKFAFVMSAANRVVAGAGTLKNYVASGNAEADRLAAVLSAAASAYQTVDDRAAYAMSQDPPQPVPNDPVPITPLLPPVVPPIEKRAVMAEIAGGDTGDGYMDAKTAAQIIHSGDPGPMRTYAGDARAFANSLREQSNAFSLEGVSWEGTAAEAAGDALRQHREWLIKMAEQYDYLAAQAEDLAAAQEKWADQHPTVEEIEQVEREMQAAIQNQDRVALRVAQDKYAALFAKSEEVRFGYSVDVTGKGLLGVPKPPSGAATVEPVTGNGDPRKSDQPPSEGGGEQQSGGGGGDPAGQGSPTAAEPSPTTSPASAQGEGKPSGGAPSGGGPPSGGEKSGGGAPEGSPGGQPGGGPPKGEPKLPTDPSLRPAAAAGGGSGAGGGGGGGAPAAPLSPAVTAETVAPAPAVGAPPGPSAGTAVGAGAMMGGGMGGMAPMHGGGVGGQNQEKKRNPAVAQDEAIYTEDRPHTEQVIGIRRRRGTQEDKESQ